MVPALMSSPQLKKLESRQYNGNKIFRSLRDSGYIRSLPEDYISAGNQTKTDMAEKLERFSSCGSVVEMSKYQSGKIAVRNANYCGLLGCWHCGNRTERKRYMRIAPKIDQSTEKFPFAYHVIFTISDGENVRDLSTFLRSSLTKWRKMGQRRGRTYSQGEYRKVRAGIFSQEIVEGRNSKKYHTHCHAVLWTDEQIDFTVYDFAAKAALAEKYGYGNIPKNELNIKAGKQFVTIDNKKIPVSKLAHEWYLATNGQAINIKAKPIESEKDHKKAIKEVIKYAVKMNENNPRRIAEIMADCHGLRFFSTVREMRYDIAGGEQPPEPQEITEKPTEVYNIQWDDTACRYVEWKPSIPVIVDHRDETRKKYAGKAAIILAEYRKERNAIARNPPAGVPVYKALDSLKEYYRKKIKIVWQEFNRLSWKPYKAQRLTEQMKTARTLLNESALEYYQFFDPPPNIQN